MYEIHISDVRTFKSCRRKWNWASPLRENLEKRIPYAPFFTGRAIHHCLEFYHRDGVRLDDSLKEFLENERETMEKVGRLWPQEEATFAEQIVLIAGMLEHYWQWTTKEKGRFSDENLEVISMETEFKVPLYNPYGKKSNKVILAGRFDGLVRKKDDGSYWLWEVKTCRSIKEFVRTLDNDEQAGAYMIAAQEVYNVPVTGVLYNLMRKKVPTRPAVRRNDGMLSQNKQIDTTAFAYVDAALKHHADDFDDKKSLNKFVRSYYGNFIQTLLERGNEFFARIPIYRSATELRNLRSDLWTVALEMTRQSTPIYPSPGWNNCNFCHFKPPCLMLNSGADPSFVFEHEYQQRQPWQTFEEVSNGET